MSVALRLYVSYRSSRSRRAIEIVESLRAPVTAMGGTCEILDVAEAADLAEEDRILATPTLIRRAPPPPRRIVGEVEDVEALLTRLELPLDLLDTAGGQAA